MDKKMALSTPSAPKRQYRIQWHSRELKIFGTLKKFLASGLLTDVVLSCSMGNKSVRAHKLILAASSWYFEKLIENSQHLEGGCSFIVLQGISFPELEAVLTFIYEGNVVLEEDKIAAFLKAAEVLKIKGIVPDIGDEPVEWDHGQCPDRDRDQCQEQQRGMDGVTGVSQGIDDSEGLQVDHGIGKLDPVVVTKVDKGPIEPLALVVCRNQQRPDPATANSRSVMKKQKKQPKENHRVYEEIKVPRGKAKYKKYSKEQMLAALKDVEENGMSCTKAAITHGIPPRTLYQTRKRMMNQTKEVPTTSSQTADLNGSG